MTKTRPFSAYATVLAMSAALSACGSGASNPGFGNDGSSGSGGSGGSSGGGNSSSGGSSGSGSSSSGSAGSSSSSGAGGASGSSGGASSGSSSGSSGSSSGVVAGADACLTKHADNVAPSIVPPAGLSASKVPQFIMIGADDNYYADGILWLVDTALAGKKNGDGTPAQMTFFITAGGGTTANGGIFDPGSVNQTPAQVIGAWQAAYAAGHEVGNHTWDHDMSNGTAGASYTADQWMAELTPSQAFLTGQANFPACELDGWRFPYLEFDEAGFAAVASSGFLFDGSMEFGYNGSDPTVPAGTLLANGSPAGCGYWCGSTSYAQGQNYWWPFTLDMSPSDFPAAYGFATPETKGVGAHPGFWEFLATTLDVPPEPWDGTPPSTIATVTGLDYNMWEVIQEQPTTYNPQSDASTAFCDAYKNTFIQRYTGNRAPWNMGIHSTIYSPDNPTNDAFFGNDATVRRAGLQCFIDYIFSTNADSSPQFPDVRVVGFHKVIEWMRNPTALP